MSNTITAITTTTKYKPNKNFTGKEDNTQAYINDVSKAIIVNNWNDIRALQPPDHKHSNNSKLSFWDILATITNNTEAVTTYLRHFYRVLHQIQAIDTVYFIEPQILNQFICAAVTHARDFKSAELEANHTQAVNLVMNGSSDLDSKLKQINAVIRETPIISKIKHVDHHQLINHGSRKHLSTTTVVNKKSTLKPQSLIPNPESISKSRLILKHLPANDAAANLSSTSISDPSLSIVATSNISTAAICNISTTATTKLEIGDGCPPTDSQFFQYTIRIVFSEFRYRLLVTPEDATPSNPETNSIQKLTSNILLTTVTNNKLLMAIFSFDLEEIIEILLFSGAAFKEKPITVMYTDAKINGHAIKLILDSGSAGSIITKQLMDQLANGVTKTPIGEIDNLLIKINSITVPIKVLVMEAIQYQALIGNDWLSKTNAVFDWMTQELQLSQNSQHTWAPTVCGGSKETNMESVSDKDDYEKGKQKKKHIWETTIGTWIDDNQNKLPPTLSWEEKRKGKEREDNIPEETKSTKNTTSGWTCSYFIHEPLPQPPYILLKCKDCGKKLSSMRAWIDNKLCLTCGKQLLNEEIWNDILGRGRMCDASCQYTILISNWVSRGMLITAAWHRAISHLEEYPHNKDEIWRIANAKVEDASPNEILEIKNNPPKPTDIVLVLNPDVFLDLKNSPEEFYEHYQNLVPTREEQKQ
ncbi:hypothetical protein G9A89_004515 [Geosiphon pyriformis]|nr:hypothetical protein G9A89_004515 [Geosiphon pyriformis]